MPVEGTILSVARAASDAALQAAADERHRLGHVVRAAAPPPARPWPAPRSSSRVLRDAGVVDAGGRGLCVVLDAAETAITGKRPVAPAARRRPPRSRCRCRRTT